MVGPIIRRTRYLRPVSAMNRRLKMLKHRLTDNALPGQQRNTPCSRLHRNLADLRQKQKLQFVRSSKIRQPGSLS